MQIVFGDFEIYYASDYTLSKMSTEEYVRDDRFEVIGYSQAIDDGPISWDVGYEAVSARLHTVDWNDTLFVAQNNRFDAMILERRFGIRPRALACAMSMARAAGLGSVSSVSLAAISRILIAAGYPISPKGNEVENNRGLRLADFGPERLASYGRYCVTDTENMRVMFRALMPLIPEKEFLWQQALLRSMTAPTIRIDHGIVAEEVSRLEKRRVELLDHLATGMGVTHAEMQSLLASKDKFRLVLESMGGAISEDIFGTGMLGFDTYPTWQHYLAGRPGNPSGVAFNIPVKLSEKKTEKAGRPIFDLAVSKKDPEFMAWIDGDDEMLSIVAQARLNTASTLNESRAKAFLRLSNFPAISIPINISGATQTHRMSGADKLNFQNLPSGLKPGQSPALRRSITAPDGYVFASGDASQIEARILAYAAQQLDLLDVFAADGDPYSVMAGDIYKTDPEWVILNKETNTEAHNMRQLGKITVLGCGFEMGWATFVTNARDTYRVTVTQDEAKRAVTAYRMRNDHICNFWRLCEWVIGEMMAGRAGTFGGPNKDLFYYDGNRTVLGMHVPGIRGPDGLWVNYPGLRLEPRERYGKIENLPVFTRARGNGRETVHLYGGRITENLVQYLAFSVGKWQSLQMAKFYPLVMNEHDAWVVLAPEAQGATAAELVRRALTHNPPWLPGCPLNAEVGFGPRLGDIKKKKLKKT